MILIIGGEIMVYIFVGATIVIYAGIGTYVVKKTIKS
ncbi:hypothetical protein BJ095_107119 [Ureibacillus chungkukjangi]|uniref:Uncharacterized protein n=1 Tax=Ureibacillus chungkukjangi TaxID=1202712 RepID=A0A318TQD5_9BACL|nr:hypothetical protein BJ095_107119 [Ureibacillus chungkukjangi]